MIFLYTSFIYNRPTTKEELFNLRHASARNVIERIFGVLKRRFRILHLAPEYDMEVQARIPVSLAALHNFIHIHDPKEGPVIGSSSRHSQATDDADGQEDYVAPVLQGDEEMDERREQIAEAMWADYQRICQERGINVDDPFDGNNDIDEDDESSDDEESSDDGSDDDSNGI